MPINYEKEYIRLWNAAEQALENVDFDKRLVASWAALRILKNAVDYGRSFEDFPVLPECEYCKKEHDPRICCPEYINRNKNGSIYEY